MERKKIGDKRRLIMPGGEITARPDVDSLLAEVRRIARGRQESKPKKHGGVKNDE